MLKQKKQIWWFFFTFKAQNWGTAGFSGADLENLMNESAILAARRNKTAAQLAVTSPSAAGHGNQTRL